MDSENKDSEPVLVELKAELCHDNVEVAVVTDNKKLAFEILKSDEHEALLTNEKHNTALVIQSRYSTEGNFLVELHQIEDREGSISDQKKNSEPIEDSTGADKLEKVNSENETKAVAGTKNNPPLVELNKKNNCKGKKFRSDSNQIEQNVTDSEPIEDASGVDKPAKVNSGSEAKAVIGTKNNQQLLTHSYNAEIKEEFDLNANVNNNDVSNCIEQPLIDLMGSKSRTYSNSEPTGRYEKTLTNAVNCEGQVMEAKKETDIDFEGLSDTATNVHKMENMAGCELQEQTHEGSESVSTRFKYHRVGAVRRNRDGDKMRQNNLVPHFQIDQESDVENSASAIGRRKSEESHAVARGITGTYQPVRYYPPREVCHSAAAELYQQIDEEWEQTGRGDLTLVRHDNELRLLMFNRNGNDEVLNCTLKGKDICLVEEYNSLTWIDDGNLALQVRFDDKGMAIAFKGKLDRLVDVSPQRNTFYGHALDNLKELKEPEGVNGHRRIASESSSEYGSSSILNCEWDWLKNKKGSGRQTPFYGDHNVKVLNHSRNPSALKVTNHGDDGGQGQGSYQSIMHNMTGMHYCGSNKNKGQGATQLETFSNHCDNIEGPTKQEGKFMNRFKEKNKPKTSNVSYETVHHRDVENSSVPCHGQGRGRGGPVETVRNKSSFSLFQNMVSPSSSSGDVNRATLNISSASVRHQDKGNFGVSPFCEQALGAIPKRFSNNTMNSYSAASNIPSTYEKSLEKEDLPLTKLLYSENNAEVSKPKSGFSKFNMKLKEKLVSSKSTVQEDAASVEEEPVDEIGLYVKRMNYKERLEKEAEGKRLQETKEAEKKRQEKKVAAVKESQEKLQVETAILGKQMVDKKKDDKNEKLKNLATEKARLEKKVADEKRIARQTPENKKQGHHSSGQAAPASSAQTNSFVVERINRHCFSLNVTETRCGLPVGKYFVAPFSDLDEYLKVKDGINSGVTEQEPTVESQPLEQSPSSSVAAFAQLFYFFPFVLLQYMKNLVKTSVADAEPSNEGNDTLDIVEKERAINEPQRELTEVSAAKFKELPHCASASDQRDKTEPAPLSEEQIPCFHNADGSINQTMSCDDVHPNFFSSNNDNSEKICCSAFSPNNEQLTTQSQPIPIQSIHPDFFLSNIEMVPDKYYPFENVTKTKTVTDAPEEAIVEPNGQFDGNGQDDFLESLKNLNIHPGSAMGDINLFFEKLKVKEPKEDVEDVRLINQVLQKSRSHDHKIEFDNCKDNSGRLNIHPSVLCDQQVKSGSQPSNPQYDGPGRTQSNFGSPNNDNCQDNTGSLNNHSSAGVLYDQQVKSGGQPSDPQCDESGQIQLNLNFLNNQSVNTSTGTGYNMSSRQFENKERLFKEIVSGCIQSVNSNQQKLQSCLFGAPNPNDSDKTSKLAAQEGVLNSIVSTDIGSVTSDQKIDQIAIRPKKANDESEELLKMTEYVKFLAADLALAESGNRSQTCELPNSVNSAISVNNLIISPGVKKCRTSGMFSDTTQIKRRRLSDNSDLAQPSSNGPANEDSFTPKEEITPGHTLSGGN